jgi:hypothetical protein
VALLEMKREAGRGCCRRARKRSQRSGLRINTPPSPDKQTAHLKMALSFARKAGAIPWGASFFLDLRTPSSLKTLAPGSATAWTTT